MDANKDRAQSGKNSLEGNNSGPPQSQPSNTAPPAAPSKKSAKRENAHAIHAVYEEPLASEELPQGDSSASRPLLSDLSESAAAAGTTASISAHGSLPPNWPDERGFIPPPPSPVRPPCCPQNGPVMAHTRIYHGNDSEFTEALASYYHFRDDARFGGWQNYLQRSDDFISFSCHMHISEMLSARGGAGETRVVWQWSDCR